MKSDFLTNIKGYNLAIVIAVIAIAGVLFGALLNSLFGTQSLVSRMSQKTPTVSFNNTPIPLFAPPATTPVQELTPLSMVAEEATATTPAESTATATANDSAPTAQAHEVQPSLTVSQPSVVTATPTQELSSAAQLTELLPLLSSLPVSLGDSFENDQNGWTPFAGYGYAVAMRDNAFQIFFSEPSFSPFLWTCDACGSFERYAYQVDMKLPLEGNVIAGIVFGSPTPIDEYPFKEAYTFMLYNSGQAILQRISASGIQTVQQWDKYHSQFKPDGQFHTLQVIAQDQTILLAVDGNALGEPLELSQTANGYLGLVVQSPNATVVYDNLKVMPLP